MRKLMLLILAFSLLAHALDSVYCDPAISTGDNDGTSWANAWQTFQQAADNCGPDTVCFCRNIDTLEAAVDMDTKSGSTTDGPIRFVGCDTDGAVNGARFVLEGNGTAANCLASFSQSHIMFENFVFRGATGNGVELSTGGGDYIWFTNCWFNSNGARGSNGGSSNIAIYHTACRADSNITDGYQGHGSGSVYAGCGAKYNGDDGWENLRDYVLYFNCEAHRNNDVNFYIGPRSWMINCVADGTDEANDLGVVVGADYTYMIGNVFTNMTTGADISGEYVYFGWNRLFGNTADTANAGPALVEMRFRSDTTVNWMSVGTDDGLVDPASEILNNKLDALGRRIEIGMGDE